MREKIFPPYLSAPVWTDLVESIDKVFSQLDIDDAYRQFQLLRGPINTGDVTYALKRDVEGKLVKIDDVEQLERDTLVKLANMLGFSISNSSLLTDDDYIRICQSLGEYYTKNKGTQNWQDFIGFCLNAQFQVLKLWTTDYVTFYEEGDVAIGTPVFSGGTWYPTTHVALEYDAEKFATIARETIEEFFYFFANINIVLMYMKLFIDGHYTITIVNSAYIEISYEE